MRVPLLVAVAVLCAAVGVTRATAGQLSVRLVEASAAPAGKAAGLDDVIDILRKSLVYPHYALLGETGAELPATGARLRVGPYSVTCTGPAESLDIAVSRDGAALVNTRLSLRPGKPVIVGGFPSGANKHALIFVAR